MDITLLIDQQKITISARYHWFCHAVVFEMGYPWNYKIGLVEIQAVRGRNNELDINFKKK